MMPVFLKFKVKNVQRIDTTFLGGNVVMEVDVQLPPNEETKIINQLIETLGKERILEIINDD